jgi:aryl-alcohol dehydrogenase-like predicted oxidoreductase
MQTVRQDSALSRVPFGGSAATVTRVGLGGEGILRTFGEEEAARSVVVEAVRQGVGYFDSARVYSDSERYLGSYWGRHREARQKIFQASKSASRDRGGALADLQQSLARLQTDHLDLWQIHDLRTEGEFQRISGPGGALEAFVEAKERGLVRHIGVTGHHDPALLTRAVEEWPVDAVLMPVNPVEEVLGGFLTGTLQAARAKGIATIGMKILGASHYVLPRFEITAELLLRYALSWEPTVCIVGCSSSAEVQLLARVGRENKRLAAEERQRLLEMFEPYARKLAYYRGTF